MNRTDGNTVNASKAPSQTQYTTYGNYQPIVGLHPGYTTLISLGIAIFIIVVYVYYEDVLELLKRVCTRRRTSSQSNAAKLAFADDRGNGDSSSTAINMTQIQTKRLLKEPAIRCECGQVHMLKECLNEEELKRYKALFCHFRSEDETKCTSVLEEITEASRRLGNSGGEPLEASDLRVDEGFASNNELPHVVECELSTTNPVNQSEMSTGASSTHNSIANSDASPSSRRKVCSINFSTINDNQTASYCNEDAGTEHSDIRHGDTRSQE